MRVKMKQIDPKTKGHELDKLLVTLFGQGKFVWLFFDESKREFWATDEEPIYYTPPGLRLFSAGPIGEQKNADTK